MKIINQLLSSRANSFTVLLSIFMIVFFLLLGCRSSTDFDLSKSCVTSDGKSVVLSSPQKLWIVNLSDGKETKVDTQNVTQIFCAPENEILSVKTVKSFENKEERIDRTASWKNSGKNYQMAQIGYLESYLGVLQNRYFISSSREFVEKSKSVGSGKSLKTIYYKVYPKSQVFTLEDSTNGQLKNYTLDRTKLGIDSKFEETYWRFFPLSLSAEGVLLFVVDTQFSAPLIYQIDMFSGKITQIGANQIKVEDIPPKVIEYTTNRDFRAVSDKAGKFVAFTYSQDNGKGGLKKIVKVFNLADNRQIISKTIENVSFNEGTPQLLFEENSSKLAVAVYGFRFDSTRSVSEFTIFDLSNGKEISTIDGEKLFKNPDQVGLKSFLGDELVFYHRFQKGVWGKETFISKVNAVSQQIYWETELKN